MQKVAAIQMCSTDKVEQNLKAAKALIEQAVNNNAKLVVLPEMFAIIGVNAKDKVVVKEKYGQGVIQSFLAEESKKHGVWILGGTIPLKRAVIC